MQGKSLVNSEVVQTHHRQPRVQGNERLKQPRTRTRSIVTSTPRDGKLCRQHPEGSGDGEDRGEWICFEPDAGQLARPVLRGKGAAMPPTYPVRGSGDPDPDDEVSADLPLWAGEEETVVGQVAPMRVRHRSPTICTRRSWPRMWIRRTKLPPTRARRREAGRVRNRLVARTSRQPNVQVEGACPSSFGASRRQSVARERGGSRG